MNRIVALAFLSIALGFGVGATLWIGLGEPRPDPRCASGWKSPSIGEQGACSHHGGVVYPKDPTPWWIRVLSIVAGGATIYGSMWIGSKLLPAPHVPSDPTKALLNKAIHTVQDVRFTYAKDGTFRERVVMPLELIQLRQGVEHSTCLVAYCHLRKAKRTFALSKMSGIVLVPPRLPQQ